MKEEEINTTEVENKLSEEQIKQLEVLRSKNPKLWFRLLYGAYKPWLRKDNGGRNSKCGCGNKTVEVDVFKLHEMYKSGKTIQELADLLKIDSRNVSKWFKKYNLYIRTKSENASGDKNSGYKGGKSYDKNGYVELHINGGKIFEHRYVVEQFLERKLTNDEVVHHINGIKDDNRIENLEVLSHSEHMKKHSLKGVKWARNYKCCKKCGTIEREHSAKGLCVNCYVNELAIKKRGYEVLRDENGKQIFSEEHKRKLSEMAIIRERNKKTKQCCGVKVEYYTKPDKVKETKYGNTEVEI